MEEPLIPNFEKTLTNLREILVEHFDQDPEEVEDLTEFSTFADYVIQNQLDAQDIIWSMLLENEYSSLTDDEEDMVLMAAAIIRIARESL